MKKWKQYSLFFLLLVSGLLLTGAGYAGEHTIYADYCRQNGWMTPALSLVFQGFKDGVGPWELFTGPVQTSAEPEAGLAEEAQGPGNAEALEPENGAAVPENGGGGSSDGTVSGNEVFEGGESESRVSGNSLSGNGIPENAYWGNGISANDASGNGVSGNSLSGNFISGNSASDGSGEQAAGEEKGQSLPSFPEAAFTTADGKQYDRFGQLIEPEQAGTVQEGIPEIVPEIGQIQAGAESAQQGETDGADTQENADGRETAAFAQVSENYFDDALFIGDSRTVGMDEYGGFQENTTFFAKTSLTIYDLFEEPDKFARLADGTKATLEEALSERKFGKIYIMLGINELGRGTTESFFTVYAEAVNRIRVLQPEALIFVQGIMRVGEEKDSTDAIFNNTNINARNQALALMADNRTIFYLEVNDAVCDENGNLVSDYTFDQIHLKAKYYQLWKDYLFAHGILKN